MSRGEDEVCLRNVKMSLMNLFSRTFSREVVCKLKTLQLNSRHIRVSWGEDEVCLRNVGMPGELVFRTSTKELVFLVCFLKILINGTCKNRKTYSGKCSSEGCYVTMLVYLLY